MNTQIIVAGLKARPVRTAVGLLAVTLEIVLILLLVGLTNGGIADSGDRIAGVGGEIIFKSADSSYVIGMNNAVLPVSMAEDIAKVEGVKVVAPIVAQTEVGGGFTMIWGIDPKTFEGMSGGFTFLDGKWFSRPDEAIIDDRHCCRQEAQGREPHRDPEKALHRFRHRGKRKRCASIYSAVNGSGNDEVPAMRRSSTSSFTTSHKLKQSSSD